ncbi:4453_t:CDS:1, partial [Paraglomus occultum]
DEDLVTLVEWCDLEKRIDGAFGITGLDLLVGASGFNAREYNWHIPSALNQHLTGALSSAYLCMRL